MIPQSGRSAPGAFPAIADAALRHRRNHRGSNHERIYTHGRTLLVGLMLAMSASVASAGVTSDSSTSGNSFVDLVLCTLGVDAYCAPEMSAMTGDPMISNRPG